MADILLAFKAGRAFRREGTNTVEPSPTKGAIYLTHGDDDLLHFQWKNRVSGQIDEDLILFPSDASFVKVAQSPGRVYVLKFSSSNQRHFFWMQDAPSARDNDFVNNLNGLLEDPSYPVTWNAEPEASTSTSAPGPATAEQLAALSNVLNTMSSSGSGSGVSADISLIDVLTPTNIAPLFTNHPELISTLFPHLPSDLPSPPTTETLQRIISTPHFRSAVASFDQGLRTGLLGGFVRSLGLPEEAGIGVGPFLRAIQEQADRQSGSGSGSGSGEDESGVGDRMETD